MFKIFITDTIYDTFIRTEEKKAVSSHSNLYKILKQQTTKILTAEQTEKLKTHPEDVLKNPSSLFILDITSYEALAIQRRYGVLCLSGENPDIAQLIDVNDEHTTEEKEPLGRGWDTVLDSVEYLPSNALILTDRYLFQNINAVYGNGFDNIRSILNELLPDELSTTYHITVIFDIESVDELYSFNDIVKRLNNIKNEFVRDYPIIMEVLGISDKNNVYKRLHNRRIVSNYFIVKMDHKLAAFNKSVGTTEQTIIPQVLFTQDSIDNHSTPPLKSMQQITKALRSFSDSLSSSFPNHISYSYAVDGKVMDKCIAIRNRLIK